MKPFHEELKALRIEKGVSIEEIYKVTKIRPAILEKLEEGDFTLVPEPFLHAFLREYAEVVGLDPNRVIARYENRSESIREEVQSEKWKPEIISHTDETGEDKPEPGPVTVRKTEITAEKPAGPPAGLPLQMEFIEDEIPSKQSDNIEQEDIKDRAPGFSGSSLITDEPRSSQGMLFGIFIVIIIIAALIIMYVTGGIH
jgi:hypothetical protein